MCQVAAIHKKVFTLQKGLRSTGEPDLLKWGLPGGGIKSAKVAPTPYVYYPPVGVLTVGVAAGAAGCAKRAYLIRVHRLYFNWVGGTL